MGTMVNMKIYGDELMITKLRWREWLRAEPQLMETAQTNIWFGL